MSISARVTDAFEKIVSGDAESALFQICAAVEETAKREGYPKGRKGYKEFLRDNIPVITAIAMGPALAGLGLAYSHPELPVSADGSSSLEDIIYHVARCGLYHSAALPPNMRFTDNQIGSDEHGNLLIPKSIVTGLIVAVVVSPANSHENTQDGYWLSKKGQKLYLNKLWGKREEFLSLLKQLQ